jgi:L-asparaginase
MEIKRILIIYTGGTIGMVSGADAGSLRPVEFELLKRYLPEIDRMPCSIEYYSFVSPIDSSNMLPEIWSLLARIVSENYDHYDGFVILHGTDTMAFSASALSFMLQGLSKPIILTGAQLPIDRVRSDGRENLITALEMIIGAKQALPEVAICFDSRVLRGNRAIKYSSEKFKAFESPNYPPLAEAGVHLEFYTQNWLHNTRRKRPVVQRELDANVGLVKFFPGMPREMVKAIFETPTLRAVVLETYGTGNLPEFSWLLNIINTRIREGLIVLNVSQCPAGMVEQGLYETSKKLLDYGVVSGQDMTTEAAIAKTMHVLGRTTSGTEIRAELERNMAGELTPTA